ncbi:MAG: hypothetical protein PHV30_07685, partial [Candidatus Margulisbacteria bacterium]|nr:hypothetical protein [Candidatus Margulisiibacteriota bacterium]
KDFANYISLFLMVTKFIYVENKIWKVNGSLIEKLERPGLLSKNLFKFLFFSRDYNEYYKSPLVLNTIYANNDFEVVHKRKSIIKTLSLFFDEERISYDKVYAILIKRYAFFREYNNPSNFYYTKGDVYSNRQFIFLFIFKTLSYLGIVQIEKKGKTMTDYYFKITPYGKQLISEYMEKEALQNQLLNTTDSKKMIRPYQVISKSAEQNQASFQLMFNQVAPDQQKTANYSLMNFKKPKSADKEKDFTNTIKSRIIRKVQSENIPNLLV